MLLIQRELQHESFDNVCCALLLDGCVNLVHAGCVWSIGDTHGRRFGRRVSFDSSSIDANPGKMLYVPAGDYPIAAKIVIHKDNSGLFGPGRIIQRNAEQPIIEIERASGVQLRDLTLTRAEEKFETNNEAILAIKCRDLVIDNVRVLDNRTRSGAITLRESQNTRVSHCLVRNYMRVTTDDRTQSPAWGYAFRCTDGTGISVSYCTGTLIEGNRIVEENLVPTPELKAQHKLGRLCEKESRERNAHQSRNLGCWLYE